MQIQRTEDITKDRHKESLFALISMNVMNMNAKNECMLYKKHKSAIELHFPCEKKLLHRLFRYSIADPKTSITCTNFITPTYIKMSNSYMLGSNPPLLEIVKLNHF